jgi:hypothetical protein
MPDISHSFHEFLHSAFAALADANGRAMPPSDTKLRLRGYRRLTDNLCYSLNRSITIETFPLVDPG